MSARAVGAVSAAREPRAPEGLPRLLAAMRDDRRPASLAEHLERHGVPALRHSSDLISLVDDSGLRGRGGAAFSTGTKLRAVAAQRRETIVLANGAEGEPMSSKDRALLRTVPHLVLDGAVLAASAVGARKAIVCISSAATREQDVVVAAIAERERARIDGRIRLRLAVVPEGFVSGEETALVRFLNGGPAKPTFVPPRPFERGVNGMSTLVQNVETLAQLALVARHGPTWFRGLGTAADPGSTLVTVSGAVARPGVHELPLGMRLADLLDEAGGLTEAADALLVGGYFGTWLAADAVPHLTLAGESLGRAGGALGAGVVVALPRSTCAVREVSRVARYLAEQSAGQCGPCVPGLRAIAAAFTRIETGAGDDRKRLLRWATEVNGRGACAHPDGATRFLGSALEVFADEIGVHLRYGRCGAQDRYVLRIPPTRRARP
jgi:NADH:ubiquinone oxidoreductase subunit F (NADH-binding)